MCSLRHSSRVGDGGRDREDPPALTTYQIRQYIRRWRTAGGVIEMRAKPPHRRVFMQQRPGAPVPPIPARRSSCSEVGGAAAHQTTAG